MANNTGIVILSILIPSIPERHESLENLLYKLNIQIEALNISPYLGIVELVVNNSSAFLNGGLSIGKKRDSLLKESTGKYVCFLDDDEDISPNYVETILRLCNEDKDVCTFRSIIKLADYWGLVDMRLVYKVNDQATPDYTVRRPPWHISPVRREFAIIHSFNDKNNAEDFEWFEKVLAHCTTESHTDRILFQYNHGAKSEADKIENHGKRTT